MCNYVILYDITYCYVTFLVERNIMQYHVISCKFWRTVVKNFPYVGRSFTLLKSSVLVLVAHYHFPEINVYFTVATKQNTCQLNEHPTLEFHTWVRPVWIEGSGAPVSTSRWSIRWKWGCWHLNGRTRSVAMMYHTAHYRLCTWIGLCVSRGGPWWRRTLRIWNDRRRRAWWMCKTYQS